MAKLLLADLLAHGVHLEPFEAVAIAQLLIESGAVAPSPDNVELSSDGAAQCAGCDATPAVSEIAALLETLIPSGTPRVSGPLRYAIARGLLEVDAPPFDSLEEFSRTLERFERGDRTTVVRELVRRRPRPVTLRIVPPLAESPAVIVEDTPRPERRRRWALAAAAAVLVGAIGLIGVARVTKSGRALPRTAAGAGRAIASAPASVVETPRPGLPRNDGRQRRGEREPSAVAGGHVPGGSRPAAQTTGAAQQTLPERGAVVEALDRQHRPIFSPAFASNGSALFFHTGAARDARSAIAAVIGDRASDDLGVMTIVDDGARNYHVQPSPDGTQIAFDSDRDGARGVYVARRDGVDVRRISGAGYAALPTWAPDSRRIAYVRAEDDDPTVWNLWVQSPGEDRPTRLTSYRSGQTWSASWFPDNHRICYSHEDRIVVLDLDTGATGTFLSPLQRRLVRAPAVSPDGSQVIFQIYRQGAWLLDLRSGAMRPVVADPTAEEFAWSPDGRRVAYHSRRDGQWGIFVISPT